MLEKMTLREKIGQMLMAGFPTTNLSTEYKRLIQEYKIANVILFSHNIKNKKQLSELCAELQEMIKANTGYPAFISVDQEGGMVARMSGDATNIPGAMSVAATGDPDNAYIVGLITGKELHALGINVNMAPDLDINLNKNNPVIGVRAYGDQKETVTAFGIKMMKGLKDGQVLSVIKHFPGHGDTAVDSHLGLPLIDKSVDELMMNELVPFKAAISNGAEGVMTSHILFPQIEKNNKPATMSREIMTDLLREKLGFNGLVFSDCLEMNAIKTYYGTAKGALEAIKAGVNIVGISHTAELVEETVRIIEEAVKIGELPVDIINASVKKILKYKEKYAQCDILKQDISVVGCEEHKRMARHISKNSITLVQSHGEKLPAIGKGSLFVGPYANKSTVASSPINKEFNFPEYMAKVFEGDFITIPTNPSQCDIENVLQRAGNFESVVIGTYNGHLNLGQIELVNKLCNVNDNVVVVALRNPYDLGMIDERAYSLAAYEYTTLAFESLVNVFKGIETPTGKLSVKI
ncbi:MAG: beta-N-acetylhexosaminidase [Ruminiclostridium sp.]